MGKTKTITSEVDQLNRLQHIIECLRGENGCPWDKKQTPQSMTIYLIEEMYELIDAIRRADNPAICEELGDVLFHILFLAAIFTERAAFSLNEVARVEADKMVRRHPHVFGETAASSVAEIKQQWHNIKKDEKKGAVPASLLDSVPRSVPPLVRAYRLTERAARVGFDWDKPENVMAKVREELTELDRSMTEGETHQIAEEFGDLLFSLVNLGRFLRVHPETALAGAIRKFETRFQYIENCLAEKQIPIEEAGLEEMDALWEAAKNETCSPSSQ